MTQAAAVLFASALAVGPAGAGSPTDSPTPAPFRLIVQLAQPLGQPTPGDQAEIARRASAAAGLPVSYRAAVSADRIALQMMCAPADCDAAVQRLRDAESLFAAVERDERRQRHAP